MSVLISCVADLDKSPLWAQGLPPIDVVEKAMDEDNVTIKNCRIHFDDDGGLVIEGLKGGKAKS